MSGQDEFDWIASLRPLTRGEPAALNLMDDAAVLPSRPGHDLVISKDAMVEGVHFLSGEDPDIIARRLLRTNLSDLAAKAAEPFGYFLMTSFAERCDAAWSDDWGEGGVDAAVDCVGRARGVAGDGLVLDLGRQGPGLRALCRGTISRCARPL